MAYDPNQLRRLRDDIDRFLVRDNEEEMKIYEALENSISKAVTDGLKPILEEMKNLINEKIDNKK